jgi:hypothetical protein
VTITDRKGKERKSYPYDKMMTPYEKLKSLPNAASYLKPGTTFKQLEDIAYAISDNEASRQMNEARKQFTGYPLDASGSVEPLTVGLSLNDRSVWQWRRHNSLLYKTIEQHAS